MALLPAAGSPFAVPAVVGALFDSLMALLPDAGSPFAVRAVVGALFDSLIALLPDAGSPFAVRAVVGGLLHSLTAGLGLSLGRATAPNVLLEGAAVVGELFDSLAVARSLGLSGPAAGIETG